MNEQLIESLADVVDLTKEGVVKGLSIIQTQVPELCEQIITYGFWSNLVGIFGFFIAFSVFIYTL